jgi:CBS domain-containing protein
MTRDVLTFGPDDSVREIAARLSARGISGAPVTDDRGAVIGMVSEGDLLRRTELGTELRRSWWMDLLANSQASAHDFTRTHGRLARDVMTRDVVSISENTPIAAIAHLMEQHHVKRLPVVRDGRLVGIVSRADLVRCLSRSAPPTGGTDARDVANEQLHARVTHALTKAGWVPGSALVVRVVEDGIVEIAGTAGSDEERRAIQILVEEVPGVVALRDLLQVKRRRGTARPRRGLSGKQARGPLRRKPTAKGD